MNALRVSPGDPGVPEESINRRAKSLHIVGGGIQAGINLRGAEFYKAKKEKNWTTEAIATSGPYLSVTPLPVSSKRPAPQADIQQPMRVSFTSAGLNDVI